MRTKLLEDFFEGVTVYAGSEEQESAVCELIDLISSALSFQH
jgi:hypothetical protein